jgi:16S rRNA G1207 methylase RsmC
MGDRDKWSLTAGLDFLDFKDLECQRAVLNPPFTKNQWIKHIEHAWSFLKPGGRLVSVCPDSRTSKKFLDFVKGKKYSIVDVEPGTFKESGTNVNTMILVIDK